jgi:hypothetical protein
MTQQKCQQPGVPEFSSREEAAEWFDNYDIGTIWTSLQG